MRLAANYALDRQALSDAERLGASPPAGSIIPETFEFALPFEPYPYDPDKAKRLLAEAGYPNGFDAGDLTPNPPYFSLGEAVANYLAAVGIKTKLRTMERAAFQQDSGRQETAGPVRLRQRALRQRRHAPRGSGGQHWHVRPRRLSRH